MLPSLTPPGPRALEADPERLATMRMAGDFIDVEARSSADLQSAADGEDWPHAKRHCGEGTSRVGIGFRGVCFDRYFRGVAIDKLADMPERAQRQQCRFCQKTCSAPDDLVPSYTMAWFMPNWKGKAGPRSPPPLLRPGGS